MGPQDDIRQIKEAHKEELLTRPNVIGVGVGYKVRGSVRTDELCVVAMVRQKLGEAALRPRDMVPPSLDGAPTDVIQVGELRALQARTDRWRPAPGGVSIGHYRITAGTLGVVVRDRTSGARLILSNNHVLANSNDAALGDPILQPGPADGGRVDRDTIARLERFCPIEFGTQPGDCSIADLYAAVGNALARAISSSHRVAPVRVNPQAANLVDAAVARPLNDADLREDILEIGVVSGTLPAGLGMMVRKSGRTTALSTGQITVLDATVTVSYGVGRTARFENQIVTTAMSQGGDSGSLLVAADALQAVGLLFAGSDQSTIHSPIQAVLDCLDVTL